MPSLVLAFHVAEKHYPAASITTEVNSNSTRMNATPRQASYGGYTSRTLQLSPRVTIAKGGGVPLALPLNIQFMRRRQLCQLLRQQHHSHFR